MIPRYTTTTIPTDGPAGNIFAIVGTARHFLLELGHSRSEIDAFVKSVFDAPSYRDACLAVRVFFPLEPDPTA